MGDVGFAVMPARDAAKLVLKKIDANYRWFSIPADPEDANELVNDWDYALSGVNYPGFVWARAMGSILRSAKAGDNHPMPKDVLDHCKIVVGSLHGEELRQIEQLRAERKAEQDRELARNRPKN